MIYGRGMNDSNTNILDIFLDTFLLDITFRGLIDDTIPTSHRKQEPEMD